MLRTCPRAFCDVKVLMKDQWTATCGLTANNGTSSSVFTAPTDCTIVGAALCIGSSGTAGSPFAQLSVGQGAAGTTSCWDWSTPSSTGSNYLKILATIRAYVETALFIPIRRKLVKGQQVQFALTAPAAGDTWAYCTLLIE